MAKRKAWAIKDRRGTIHLDKICMSKSEAWGLLVDELHLGPSGRDEPTIEDLKAKGYDCVRVEIQEAQS